MSRMHARGASFSHQLVSISLLLKIHTAHRTLIVRKLKGLEEIIPYTAVHWEMHEKGVLNSSCYFCHDSYRFIVLTFTGWRFAASDENVPGANVTPDPHHSEFTHLRQIYFKVDPEYKGRFTVPTLYDHKQGRIVNNEVYLGPYLANATSNLCH